jgi:hypothetical protein
MTEYGRILLIFRGLMQWPTKSTWLLPLGCGITAPVTPALTVVLPVTSPQQRRSVGATTAGVPRAR